MKQKIETRALLTQLNKARRNLFNLLNDHAPGLLQSDRLLLERGLKAIDKQIAKTRKALGLFLHRNGSVSGHHDKDARTFAHVIGVRLNIIHQKGRSYRLAWQANYSTDRGQCHVEYSFGMHSCAKAWKLAVAKRKKEIDEEPSRADLRCPPRKKIIEALEKRIGVDWESKTYPPLDRW